MNKPTPKESEVLKLRKTGLTNREIGERLKLTEKTIKWHVDNLMKKGLALSRSSEKRLREVGLQ